MIHGISLSKRRSQMAIELEKADNTKAAEFDYRRRVSDDIKTILEEAEVFKSRVLSGAAPSALDRYEQDTLIRRLADDITAYIVK